MAGKSGMLGRIALACHTACNLQRPAKPGTRSAAAQSRADSAPEDPGGIRAADRGALLVGASVVVAKLPFPVQSPEVRSAARRAQAIRTIHIMDAINATKTVK